MISLLIDLKSVISVFESRILDLSKQMTVFLNTLKSYCPYFRYSFNFKVLLLLKYASNCIPLVDVQRSKLLPRCILNNPFP